MFSVSCSLPQQAWPKKGLAAVILLASVALLLQGCATLSEDECLAADWWIIGQKDGFDMRPRSYLAEHQEACAEYGVTPDRKAYAEGYQSGRQDFLQGFCTRFNGYTIGRRGDSYIGVCPDSMEESFLAGFRRGKEVHGMEMEVWDIKRERRKLRGRIDELEEELGAQRTKFESDESSLEDRNDAWTRIGEIEEELEKLDLDYENSATRQADALARLEEAAERARNDGYSDSGGLLQTYRNIREIGDAFD